MGLTGPILKVDFPWRPPDVARFARTAQVREVRLRAAEWIERQFAHLQAEAPWLVRGDEQVSDTGRIAGTHCRRTLGSGLLGLRLGVHAQLQFTRQAAVVFGFDGTMPSRILDLIRVLERAGWNLRLHDRKSENLHAAAPERITRIWVGNDAATGHWSGPQEPAGGPPQTFVRDGEQTWTYPASTNLVWTTRTGRHRSSLDKAWPTPKALSSAYVPLEYNGSNPPHKVGEFSAPTLRRHEHAVAIMFEVCYFASLGGARVKRVPKQLKPRFW